MENETTTCQGCETILTESVRKYLQDEEVDKTINCAVCGKNFDDIFETLDKFETPNFKPKWNKNLALFLSIILPGMGLIYRGFTERGFFWFFLALVGYFIFIPLGLAVHVFSVCLSVYGDPYKENENTEDMMMM